MPHRVLVVDDDALIRSALAGCLRRCGFIAATAAHGSEALEILSNSEFDLVLADLRMPVMDGLELIRRMRMNERATPVIAMSGGLPESGDLLQESLRLGACDVLEKPFSLERLVAAVNRVLDGQGKSPSSGT